MQTFEDFYNGLSDKGKEIYDNMSESEKEKARQGYKLLCIAVENLVPIIKSCVKTVFDIAKRFTNRRVFHLSRYGKKSRTRKKNQRRITKTLRRQNNGRK